MKNIVLLTIIFAAGCMVFLGCASTNAKGESLYKVTVQGGSGSGKYAAGETVTIQVKPGKGHFMTWASNKADLQFENPRNETTTFVMVPAAVKITPKRLYDVAEIEIVISGAWDEYDSLSAQRRCFVTDDEGYLAIGYDDNAKWMVMSPKPILKLINFETLSNQINQFAFRNVETGRFINAKDIPRPLPDLGTSSGTGKQIKVSDFEDDPSFYWGISRPSGGNNNGVDGRRQAFDTSIYEYARLGREGTAMGDIGIWDTMFDHGAMTMAPSENDKDLYAILLHTSPRIANSWDPRNGRYDHEDDERNQTGTACGGGRHTMWNILY